MKLLKKVFESFKKKTNNSINEEENISKPKSESKEHISREKRFDQLALYTKDTTLMNCHKYGIDLVAFHDHGGGCCETCAKYRGRVYSISGTDPIFPPLPEYALVHGNFHEGCRCMISPYFGETTIWHKGEQVDPITCSNRSWVDDRTEEEYQQYQEYLKLIEKEERKELDREEYNKLLEMFPNDAPKSFAAYRRMKSAKTTNFLKLVESSKEKGLYIYDHEE